MSKVIVVEDDARFRVAIRTFLRARGHEVTEAANGKELLRLLEQRHDIDLVLTDVNMPEMDGIEALIALRREHPHIPVIVMSGGGLIEKDVLLENADWLGAVRSLAKPFELDELDRAIAESLESGAPE